MSSITLERRLGDVMVEDTKAQPSGLEAWQRSRPWWELYFAAVVLGTMAVVIDRWVAVVLLAAMAVWYVVLGRRALWTSCAQWIPIAYLAGVAVLLVAAVTVHGGASFVLFALSPQAYMAVGFKRGTIPVLILNLIRPESVTSKASTSGACCRSGCSRRS
jgi:hypothetical protein